MMKKTTVILFLLLICCSASILAQNTKHNLMKYWYLRERFRNQFVIISPNNEQGTNIPAERRLQDIKFREIHWDDGNGSPPYYLGFLATEYRLLKDYGQNYQATLNELVYALRAIERLDKTGESNWRGYIDDRDLNGFFIRHDVDTNFGNRWGNTHPDFHNMKCYSTFQRKGVSWPEEMSQDNLWHYFLNFALVKKLVDDKTLFNDGTNENVTINEWIDKIVFRIMTHVKKHGMICKHFCIRIPSMDFTKLPPRMVLVTIFDETICAIDGWLLKNPVTGKPVHDPPNGTIWQVMRDKLFPGLDEGAYLWLFSSGFANAANKITNFKFGDLNNNFSSSYIMQKAFEKIAMHSYEGFNLKIDIPLCAITPFGNYCETINLIDVTLAPHKRDPYGESALLTVMGSGFYNYSSEYIFEHLRNISSDRSSELERPAYEHFSLIYLILHGQGNEINQFTDKSLTKDLLNQCPDCGPFNTGEQSSFSNWSSTNRLVWPENWDSKNWLGEYSGLDYMLLHNLYWLVYQHKYPMNEFVSKTYPIHGSGSQYFPKTITAANKILADNKLKSNANVTYHASNEVVLLPGFETELGTDFTAYGDGTGDPDNIDFKYIHYEPDCSNRKTMNYSVFDDSIQNYPTTKYETINESDFEIQIPDTIIIYDKCANQTENIFKKPEILIYPNPTKGFFSIVIPENQNQTVIEITDITGIIVQRGIYSSSINEFNLSDLSDGIYTIRIKSGTMNFIEKLIIQK